MNTGFYKDIDTNLEQAFLLCEREFSHNELLNMLLQGNIPEKQIAALKLDNIYSKEEADILISNLVGCDGKIREAVALKINSLLVDDNLDFFATSENAEIFSKATIDINANICRLVIDSVIKLKQKTDFVDEYTNLIAIYANQALDEIDKFVFRDKKYVINKQIFKLYWTLEALKFFSDCMEKSSLCRILNRAVLLPEYTIREKVAQIVLNLDCDEAKILLEKLEKDENYYVRNVFLNH